MGRLTWPRNRLSTHALLGIGLIPLHRWASTRSNPGFTLVSPDDLQGGFAAEVEGDITSAAQWYEDQQSGLGLEFVDEVLRVFDALGENPIMNSRRHSRKNIRWRYPERFPYRVVEPECTVVVACVLHAARHDRHWKKRV